MSLIRLTGLFLDILLLAAVSSSLLVCKEGQYKAGDTCLACPAGSFNDHTDHQDTDCKRCTQANSNLRETLIKNCTSSSDSNIGCIPTYYRVESKHGNGECYQCTSCEAYRRFEVKKCESYSDTVCCPQKNMKMKDGQCTLYCGEGELLNEESKQCQPCPEETYMSEHQHTNTACKPCPKYPEFDDIKIKSPCNRTHPPVTECKPDHYKVEYVEDDCRRCSLCLGTHVIKPCSVNSNTVCGPLPAPISSNVGEQQENSKPVPSGLITSFEQESTMHTDTHQISHNEERKTQSPNSSSSDRMQYLNVFIVAFVIIYSLLLIDCFL